MKKEKKQTKAKEITKKQIKALESLAKGEVLFDEPMSKHTSLRIGGPADVFLRPASKEDITDVMAFIHKEGIEYFALGRGSNLIVGDKGIRGLVIAMKFGMDYLRIKGEDVVVGASYDWPKLTLETIKKGLSGLEPTAGIPASVGGAVFMNAGAYGTEVFNFIQHVEVIREGKPVVLSSDEIEFGYRKTNLETDIILEIKLKLKKMSSPDRLLENRQTLLTKRNEQQPLNQPCVGSVFKNPEGNYAGKLIMDSKLSGKFLGNVQVSAKHANFIVNTGGGKAKDMMALIKIVVETVEKDSGIKLEMEVKKVGQGF